MSHYLSRRRRVYLWNRPKGDVAPVERNVAPRRGPVFTQRPFPARGRVYLPVIARPPVTERLWPLRTPVRAATDTARPLVAQARIYEAWQPKEPPAVAVERSWPRRTPVTAWRRLPAAARGRVLGLPWPHRLPVTARTMAVRVAPPSPIPRQIGRQGRTAGIPWLAREPVDERLRSRQTPAAARRDPATIPAGRVLGILSRPREVAAPVEATRPRTRPVQARPRIGAQGRAVGLPRLAREAIGERPQPLRTPVGVVRPRSTIPTGMVAGIPWRPRPVVAERTQGLRSPVAAFRLRATIFGRVVGIPWVAREAPVAAERLQPLRAPVGVTHPRVTIPSAAIYGLLWQPVVGELLRPLRSPVAAFRPRITIPMGMVYGLAWKLRDSVSERPQPLRSAVLAARPREMIPQSIFYGLLWRIRPVVEQRPQGMRSPFTGVRPLGTILRGAVYGTLWKPRSVADERTLQVRPVYAARRAEKLQRRAWVYGTLWRIRDIPAPQPDRLVRHRVQPLFMLRYPPPPGRIVKGMHVQIHSVERDPNRKGLRVFRRDRSAFARQG